MSSIYIIQAEYDKYMEEAMKEKNHTFTEDEILENEILENQLIEEERMVTVTLEDGSTVECMVLDTFEANNRAYVAVLPEDDESTTVYLYRYDETENGKPKLTSIETDEEFDIVEDAFNEMLHNEIFDEISDIYFSDDDDVLEDDGMDDILEEDDTLEEFDIIEE